MNTRAPENTRETVRRHPEGFLVESMVAGVGPAILAQESQGQRSFVGSDTLPTEMGAKDRLALEIAGVRFGETVPGDSLFQYVQLPAGWRKEAADHSMWSYLLDDKGRRRASIFYKAAFYDRS